MHGLQRADPFGLGVGLVDHIDHPASASTPGEDDAHPLADAHLDPVGDQVVEGAVKVGGSDRDDHTGVAARHPPGQAPAALRRSSARSVDSQVNPAVSRPKCP